MLADVVGRLQWAEYTRVAIKNASEALEHEETHYQAEVDISCESFNSAVDAYWDDMYEYNNLIWFQQIYTWEPEFPKSSAPILRSELYEIYDEDLMDLQKILDVFECDYLSKIILDAEDIALILAYQNEQDEIEY